MEYQYAQTKPMKQTAFEFSIFGIFFAVICGLVLFFLPDNSISSDEPIAEFNYAVPNEISEEEALLAQTLASIENYFDSTNFEEQVIFNASKTDAGLELYRQNGSRAAVEWFYTHLTGDREVALAVLENADKFNIPLPLAFSLAHTESSFNPQAQHVNTNESIDRGLFQLNSNSFPNLEVDSFFDAEVSSYYGLSHLRYCLNSCGNEISALAMYNAGYSAVRKNNTPYSTLNYIAQIENFKNVVADTFDAEVVAFYPLETETEDEAEVQGLLVAK